MARPKRDGLLYFSFDTDFFYADNRIRTLRAKFGSDGLIFYIYLLTEIYRNGYYLRWNEESEDNAIADLNLTEGLIKQILTFLINRSLLTSILVNSDTIITALGIQKRYQEAVKSLKRDVFVDEQIWLLNKEETANCIKFTQNESKSEKSPNKSGKNESKSEKNHTKEIKRNKTKGNENSADALLTSFNAEQAWVDTFAIYPKKSAAVMAKQVWMDKLLDVLETNRKDVAQLIYLATKMYLDDYEQKNPDDVVHRYIPKYSDWLVNDCDYWISEVEKRQRGDDS